MAPIRKGDGTGLAGEGYSQVRKGDGTVLWNAIPDSVVNRWPFAEGSGGTAFDSAGTDDGTINGAAWVSGVYVSDNALSFDGTDDGVDTGATMPAGSRTLLATVDFDADITSLQSVQGVLQSTTAGGCQLRLKDTNIAEFELYNDSDVGFLPSTSITQGKHRIVGILDISSSEAKIAVDGTVEDTVSVSGDFTTQLSNHKIGRRPDDLSAYYAHIIDEPMIGNDAYTSTQLSDDYKRQPWS